jgi:hypothetical protein
MDWVRRSIFAGLLATLWVAGAGMALIDAGQFLVIFREDRSGADLAAGCLLAGGAVLGIVFWTRRIGRQSTDAAVLRHCYWLLAAVLIAKIGWCCWLDSAQPNDMGRYWRYGQWLAAGNYEELFADGMFSLGLFVRRAFFYTAPIFRFVGREQWHLEIVNVALQMGTLWMLFLWGRSAIGLKATACALPWYVLYPDWWFAPTLASHDIPAMLLVSCVLWAVEGMRQEICRLQAGGESASGRLVFYSVFTGVCTSYLHMVRDFGSIMLLTGMLGTVFYFWGYGNFRTLWAVPFTLRSQELAVAQCLVLFCLVYLGTNRLLLIVEEIPELQESSVLGISHLTSSVGTDEDAVFWALAPWFLQYSPALPASERTEVFTRKLLWEKLGKGLHFWPHVYRKKHVLAYSARTMEYALGGIGGDAWFCTDLTHLASLRVFCSLVYGYVALLFLIRLLIIFEFPPQTGEIVSLILAFGFLSPLLLATEAQHAYDQLLAMPMGAAVGVLSVGAAKPLGVGRPSLWNRRLLVGASGLTLVVGLQALLGVLVNVLGLTFATFDLVECRAGDFAVAPERLTLDMTQRPGDTGESTDLADLEFQLSGKSLEDGVLKFFLSSDHHRQQLMNPLDWGDCPWTWEILIDGVVVRSGLVRDLSRPVLMEVALPAPGQQSAGCRLVVHGDPEWKAEFPGWEELGIIPRPRIAMEYCY